MVLCRSHRPQCGFEGNNLSDAHRATTPGQARALSQLVASPLTPAAIFLVVTVNPGPEAETAIRSLCPELANLLRAIGFRDLEGNLSCIMSFGSEVWARLFGIPQPAELHPFRATAAHRLITPNFPASWENTGNFAYFASWEQPKGAKYRKDNSVLRESSRRPRTGKFRVPSGN